MFATDLRTLALKLCGVWSSEVLKKTASPMLSRSRKLSEERRSLDLIRPDPDLIRII